MPGQGNVKIQEAPEGVRPICPHCRQELAVIWAISKHFALLGSQRILVCPHCRAALGYSTAVA